jgi:hypothetical protein
MTTSEDSEHESDSVSPLEVEALIERKLSKIEGKTKRREWLIGSVAAVLGAVVTPVMQKILDSFEDGEQHSMKVEITNNRPFTRRHEVWIHQESVYPKTE